MSDKRTDDMYAAKRLFSLIVELTEDYEVHYGDAVAGFGLIGEAAAAASFGDFGKAIAIIVAKQDDEGFAAVDAS